MSATILCGLLALSFTSTNNSVSWLWQDNKPVAVVLALLSGIFASLWITYQRQHTKSAA